MDARNSELPALGGIGHGDLVGGPWRALRIRPQIRGWEGGFKGQVAELGEGL
jgi:hypothetical protein